MLCRYFLLFLQTSPAVKYEVLTAASIKIIVICDVTPFSLAPTNPNFSVCKK
jgi:hypothetical protein